MTRWSVRPIRELCLSIVDCVNKTAPVVDHPTPYRMIRTTNVKDGRIELETVRHVTEDVYRRWVRRGDPQIGDIVLTREAPLGEVGMVKDASGVFLGQRLVLYRPDPGQCDGSFLLHAMRSQGIQAQIRAFGSGATVEHVRVPDCAELLVACPDVGLQRRIGSVLAAFDELIEINERRIELLEDLARSLYREWFVHLRFPGHEDAEFVDSELGAIPEGWTVCTASKALVINPRLRPLQAVARKVTMADVDERVSTVFPSAMTSQISGSKFERDDVLLARITPCLENGKTAMVRFLEPGEVGVGSTEFIVLRGVIVGPAFVYSMARSERFREHAIKSMSGSSGRQRVAKGVFDSLMLVSPPARVADEFEVVAGPMFAEVFQLASLSRSLAATRDLLLPRLVTGRLDISDVDLGDLLPAEAA